MVAVLDASAVLAVAQSEPGSAAVVQYLPGSVMSAVNHAEVLFGLTRKGVPSATAAFLVKALQVEIVEFNEALAEIACALGGIAASVGLSLSDRACLATAVALGLPVVTADRVWAELDVDVEVVTIR